MQTRHCKAVSASRAEVHVKHHGNMKRGHTSSAWRHDHRKLHREGNIPAGKMTGAPKEEWQREFRADLHKHKSMKWNNTANWRNLEQVREGADADTQGQGAEQQDGGRRGTGARAPLTSPERLHSALTDGKPLTDSKQRESHNEICVLTILCQAQESG